jgi:uncharacterized protein YndB with AHSA1/START domain
MTAGEGRTDTASMFIAASAAAIYRAMTRADVIVEWLPPDGMTGRPDEFDARPGGRMRLVLTYNDEEAVGKSAGTSRR